jgi:CspA family cold shock protein
VKKERVGRCVRGLDFGGSDAEINGVGTSRKTSRYTSEANRLFQPPLVLVIAHFVVKVCVMNSGTVKWFNDAKGYGFIMSEDGQDVFVHYSTIQSEGFRTLPEGAKVSFDAEKGPKGLKATSVVVSK